MKKVLFAVIALAGLGSLPLALRAVEPPPTQQPHGDLKTDCGECHSAQRWSPVENARFDHSSTGFVLEGAHRQVPCRNCHESLVFSHVGTACADCHKDVHRGELGPLCDACHTPRTWSNQREMFQVHNRTRFPLLAAHASLDCQACHKGQRQGEFANTPTQCFACHAETYAATTTPNHAQAGFSTRCEQCHGVAPRGWRSVVGFAHPASFPLTGQHARLSCSACHTGGFGSTSRECYACHQQDYQRATNPNHVAGSYPRQCDECHTGTSWQDAKFDHGRTRFPLTGGHAGLACDRCHRNGQYAGTSTQCYTCHQANYQQAANPSHAGFPTSCETCHTTNAWRPASFDHSRTRFPLTGAHTQVACARCHPSGQYTGTSSDCYACHRSAYDGTTNPNHRSAGFPTRCSDCHTTSAWRPASFDHDGRYFPIYSGKHRGKWGSCGDCHVSGSNYGVFECINCHEHNRSDTDKDHRGVGGYQYNSASCYRCHPRGSED